MAVINIVIFTTFFFPPVFVFREEGISLLWSIIYLSKTETVGNLYCLSVDAGPANDIDVFVVGAMLQGLDDLRFLPNALTCIGSSVL